VKEFEERQKREIREFDDAKKIEKMEAEESSALKTKITAFKFDLPTPDQNAHPQAFPPHAPNLNRMHVS
jgi:hypothetical protein